MWGFEYGLRFRIGGLCSGFRVWPHGSGSRGLAFGVRRLGVRFRGWRLEFGVQVYHVACAALTLVVRQYTTNLSIRLMGWGVGVRGA